MKGRFHSLRIVIGIVLALVAIAVVLVQALFIIEGFVSRGATLPPLAQVERTGQEPFGTTNQNNVSGYLATQGYRVDGVGHPKKPDGTSDAEVVTVLMPLQSPTFRLGENVAGDPEIQKQILAGFTACERFYSGITQAAVGLEWQQYILMFSANATDVRDVQAGTTSNEAFWTQVAPTAALIYANTWQPVYETNFVSKDFTGADNWGAALPPNAEPPLKGKEQVRVQLSTAYLPAGEEVMLVATTLDSSGKTMPGQHVRFTYSTQDQEAHSIGIADTGADGAARMRFAAPQGVQGAILVGVNADNAGSPAASPIIIGPKASGDAALGAITESLSLQGYDVLNVLYDAQGSEGASASVLAEMAAPRFDLRVRAEILSLAGTLFTVYPTLEEARPLLLYRAAGNSFQLVFEVKRSDWQAWLGGTINENELWERIQLSKIIDAEDGHPVDQRQFLSKNFTDIRDTLGLVIPKSVESTMVKESWGDQLNIGPLQVPAEAFAGSFEVKERTPGTEFAIYPSTDLLNPVYKSSEDADGSKLRGLRLGSGQYVLSLEGGSAPQRLSIAYVERLVDSADAAP